MRVINTEKAPAALGPYVQGLIVGDFLYISGQLPIDPVTMQKVGGSNIKDQTRQTLINLKAILEQAGASLNDVVRCTVFIKNMDDFAMMNEVYSEFFGSWKPTRSAVEVSRIAKDALIEIDAIAYIKGK